MMTFIALFNFSVSVVIIMPKNSGWTPLIPESVAINYLHVFLGMCKYDE